MITMITKIVEAVLSILFEVFYALCGDDCNYIRELARGYYCEDEEEDDEECENIVFVSYDKKENKIHYTRYGVVDYYAVCCPTQYIPKYGWDYLGSYKLPDKRLVKITAMIADALGYIRARPYLPR